MSLVNLSHVCSHIQNASKARLGLTSIPYTKLHARLSHELLRAGFISHVTLGGMQAPSGEPSPILGHLHNHNNTIEAAAAAASLRRRGTEGAAAAAAAEEDVDNAVTQANRASRRLWLGLKYWDNRPVISRMSMISRPTRRIRCRVEELARLSRGQKAGYVDGMRQVGEAIFVSTDRGLMELRECVERGLGGQLMCRVW